MRATAALRGAPRPLGLWALLLLAHAHGVHAGPRKHRLLRGGGDEGVMLRERAPAPIGASQPTNNERRSQEMGEAVASAFADSTQPVEHSAPSSSQHRFFESKPPPPKPNRGFYVAMSRRKMLPKEDDRPGQEAIGASTQGNWEHYNGRAAAAGVSMAFLDPDIQKPPQPVRPPLPSTPKPPLFNSKAHATIEPRKQVVSAQSSSSSSTSRKQSKGALPAKQQSKPKSKGDASKPVTDLKKGAASKSTSVKLPANAKNVDSKSMVDKLTANEKKEATSNKAPTKLAVNQKKEAASKSAAAQPPASEKKETASKATPAKPLANRKKGATPKSASVKAQESQVENPDMVKVPTTEEKKYTAKGAAIKSLPSQKKKNVAPRKGAAKLASPSKTTATTMSVVESTPAFQKKEASLTKAAVKPQANGGATVDTKAATARTRVNEGVEPATSGAEVNPPMMQEKTSLSPSLNSNSTSLDVPRIPHSEQKSGDASTAIGRPTVVRARASESRPALKKSSPVPTSRAIESKVSGDKERIAEGSSAREAQPKASPLVDEPSPTSSPINAAPSTPRVDSLATLKDSASRTSSPIDAATSTPRVDSSVTLQESDRTSQQAPSTATMSLDGSAPVAQGPRSRDAVDEAETSVLKQAATLRASAKDAWEAGQWNEASELYARASELLLMIGTSESDKSTNAPDTRRNGGPVAAELQKCRLSLSVCLAKQKRWREVIESCSDIIEANARCGTAWFRRGQALAALGEADAAVWDLERASSLLPSNAQVKRALTRARGALQDQKLKVGNGNDVSPFGGLFTPGSSSEGSAIGHLFGAAGSRGSDASAGGSGPFGMLSGLGGAKANAGSAGGLEALLDSPLLASMGGGLGSGASTMIGLAKRALAFNRGLKQFWKSIKPYLPLLFYLVLLLPTVIAVWQGRLNVWPFW